MKYEEQLKHPKWQRRRLQILERAGFECEWCGANDKTLHVHHKRYRKGAMVWEYDDHELQALCEDCHKEEHEWRTELTEILTRLDISDLAQIVGYAKSLIVHHAWEADDSTKLPPIAVRSAEEAEALGRGLGLSTVEAHYILARVQPHSMSDLLAIDIATGKRQSARRAEIVRSLEELFAMADALQLPKTEL